MNILYANPIFVSLIILLGLVPRPTIAESKHIVFLRLLIIFYQIADQKVYIKCTRVLIYAFSNPCCLCCFLSSPL